MRSSLAIISMLVIVSLGLNTLLTLFFFDQQHQLNSLEAKLNAIPQQSSSPIIHQQLVTADVSEDIRGQLEDLEMLLLRRTSQQLALLENLDEDTKQLKKTSRSLQEQAADFSSTVEETLPSTVMIGVRFTIDPQDAPSLEFPYTFHAFEDYYVNSPESFLLILGSGSVVSDSGHVLTNRHVIDAAQEIAQDPTSCDFFFDDTGIMCSLAPEIELVSFSGEHSAAFFVDESPSYDLALVSTSFSTGPLSLGNSGSLSVGQPVAALGNPVGLQFTFTQGTISALNRDLGPDDYNIGGAYWIQTDTSINGGNSGGPLIDKSGNLIGVVTSGIGFTDSGLNFAIPSDIARAEFFEI